MKGRFLTLILLTSLLGHAEPTGTTLYLLGYDVPEEQRELVVKQDLATVAAHHQKSVDNASLWQTYVHGENMPYPVFTRENYPHIALRDLCNKNTDSYNEAIFSLFLPNFATNKAD